MAFLSCIFLFVLHYIQPADKPYVTFRIYDFTHSPSPYYVLFFLTACPLTPPFCLLSPPHSFHDTWKLYLALVFFLAPLSLATTSCLSPLASFPPVPCFCVALGAATESRENSFSRSRSSSVSSIDRDTKEAITTLQFGESYGRKGDAVPTPCLWVGTSLGVVLLIPMSIPTDQEERMEEPVSIGPSGRSQ